MSTEDGYSIEDARMAIRGAGFVGALLDPQEEETVRFARLAIREHERAERLERNSEARERLLTRRTDALRAAERRVDELEQRQRDVTHAVEKFADRKVEHFTSCDWCGACSPEDADGRCEPREDQTGEPTCPGIDGPVAEVWDDGANPVALMLREELSHAALVADESKRMAQRVDDLKAAAEAYRLDGAAMEARALRAEAAVARVALSPCPRPGCAITEVLALLDTTTTTGD